VDCCDESVCPSVCSLNLKTTRPDFTIIFVHVAYHPRLVLLWCHYETSCASGFVDVVTLSHNAPVACHVLLSDDRIIKHNC